jgi:protein-S-isoprenylcysteine O-methyltransferase Ste14
MLRTKPSFCGPIATEKEVMGASNKVAANPVKTAFSRQAVVLDICERAFVCIVFSHFAWLMLSGAARPTNFLDMLLVVSEAIPFVLIMMRSRSETLSRRPTDWLLGMTGVTLPLLVQPAAVDPLLPATLCFFIMVLGTFIQFAAKVTLGRSFGVIAANRGVVTLGPYRFIRHPMYLGYTVTHLGFLLSMPSAATALLYATTLGVQILRILREENVLVQDEAYRAFAKHVRFRLVPGVF